jgi:hypothetical protein
MMRGVDPQRFQALGGMSQSGIIKPGFWSDQIARGG